MKKKIVLTVLAVVLLLGCGFGAWSYFSGTGESANEDWVWFGNYSGPVDCGALSDLGYYYVPRGDTNANALCYMDFGTGASVVLCSKIGCYHGEPECDAYVSASNMFFTNNTLYYTDRFTGTLYSRDATGLSLREICLPGKQFAEEKKSISSGRFIPIGDYAYYMGTVQSEQEESSVALTELTYLGRIHLPTGKDEVLARFEDADTRVFLIAARDGSCLLFSRQWLQLDPEEPGYREKYDSQPCSLLRYDVATGEFTTLFEKTVGECLEIGMVADGKVYYNSYGNTGGKRGNTYTYDLDTGKHALVLEHVTVQHLGGGYAFVKHYGSDEQEFYDLRTGKTLPDEMADYFNFPRITLLTSDHGLVFYGGIYHGEGKGDIIYSYMPYKAMADGLDLSDRLDAYSYESNMTIVDSTTQPSEPSDPTEPNGSNEKPDSAYVQWPFDDDERVPDEEFESTVQYLPETVENPQGLPVLKWVCLMESSRQVWTEDAVHELNRMLADRSMPFRVQFVMLNTKNSGTGADWFSRAEAQEALKEADLIFANMSPNHRKEYLMPITEYVTGDAQPSLKNAVPHELNWLTGTVEGEIYGISANPLTANGHGWSVDSEFMKEYGLTEADFNKDFWEMDELFAFIFEKNGNKPFLYLNKGTSGYLGSACTIKQTMPNIIREVTEYVYPMIGGFYAIDPTGDTPKIVNMLDTEIARNIQQAALRYIEAGYITVDTGDWRVGTFVSAREHAVIRYDSRSADTDETKILRSKITIDSLANRSMSMTGVAAVSQHKNEALALLNLIAEDEAFRKQLFVGKEGRDYTLRDGVYATVNREDGAYYRMDFLSSLSRFNEILASEYTYLPTAEGKTKLQTYVEDLDAVEDILMPATFSNAEFKAEWAAIGKAVNKYLFTFTHFEDVKTPRGLEPAMTAERYDQMLQELKEAGSEAIEAELQRQLDEWLAANPDWQ